MRFYEVSKKAVAGFPVAMLPSPTVSAIRSHTDLDGRMFLPLGNSLRRYLVHPEDRKADVRLLFGRLEETNAGLCLVKQPRKEAKTERTALVIVGTALRPALGGARLRKVNGLPSPRLLKSVHGAQWGNELYLFEPGNGLMVDWHAPVTEGSIVRRRRFVISWDGEELQEKQMRRLPR